MMILKGEGGEGKSQIGPVLARLFGCNMKDGSIAKISAATRQGVDALPALVYSRLKELPPVKVFEAEYVKPSLVDAPTRPFTVERTGAHEFTVDAPWLERILAGTNVEDYESLQYFQTQLGDSGILDELVRQNVEEDDTIKIGEYEFDYVY